MTITSRAQAERTLRRYLQDTEKLARALCLTYESYHEYHQSGQCHSYLVPDGREGWMLTHTDIHPLALFFPVLSGDTYLHLKRDLPDIDIQMLPTLLEIVNQVLSAWREIAFLADDPSNPFYQGADDGERL